MKNIIQDDDIKKVFENIQVNDEQVKILKHKISKKENIKNQRTFRKYALTAAICCLILTVGGVAAAAMVDYWNNYMKDNYHVKNQDITKYKENGLLNQPEGELSSCTQKGVNVTVLNTVVDSYFALVSLEITGYDLKKVGSVPEFQCFDAYIGEKLLSCYTGFYDGTLTDSKGKPILPNGEKLQKNSDGTLIFPYAKEDGKLEYNILITSNGEKDYFFNKNVDIQLSNLGQYINSTDPEMSNIVRATWNLSVQLTGNESIYNFSAQHPELGQTGLKLDNIQLSPLSVRATIKADKKISYNMIPEFLGVKMKDGTIYECGFGKQLEALSNEASKFHDTWILLSNVYGIIEKENVEALLFENPQKYVGLSPNEEVESVGDDYYEIKIQPE